MLQETCKDSSGWCLTYTGHYFIPKLHVSFHAAAAVEYIWTAESKKKETSTNIWVSSLQLLLLSRTCRIHLSSVFMMTSSLQSMAVATPTHYTFEMHWKCQHSLEKYQEAGASMEILPLK